MKKMTMRKKSFETQKSSGLSKARVGLAYLLMLIMMGATQMAPVMTSSWSKFQTSMKDFFETGLGGPGMQGVGIAIAVIGIVAAIVSFVVHKFNPQSRMPGWITCLVIGLAGAIAMSGIGKPLQLLEQARDTIFGWVGL